MVFELRLSHFIAMLILWLVQAVVLWATGKAVSEEGTKFSDALIVAAVGSLVYWTALWSFVIWVMPLMPGYPEFIFLIVLGVILACIYIPLIMHFFDTSLQGALIVGLLAIAFAYPVVLYVLPIILLLLTSY
jgi:hypothetical protein